MNRDKVVWCTTMHSAVDGMVERCHFRAVPGSHLCKVHGGLSHIPRGKVYVSDNWDADKPSWRRLT